MRNGKPVAVCFANGLAKKGRETVPTSEIIAALKIDSSLVPNINHELVSTFKQNNQVMTDKIIENWEV